MSFHSWIQEKADRLDWYDIGLIKWSTLFFTLLIAKLWDPVLSLSWQTYLIIALILAARPVRRAYFPSGGKRS